MKYAVLMAALAVASPVAAQEKWTVQTMNQNIEQTNFIIADNCSATLISLEHRLLLTNHHCVDAYIKNVKREVVDDKGFVTERMVEEYKDVPVSQKKYDGHRMISRANWIADIVAYDIDVDLAIIQIADASIPHTIAAAIFAGEEVLRGESVYAVGNPLGMDATVTRGIISSVTRTLNVGGKEHPYYQTDAGIAGGSSGGSLYNEFGELVGVPGAGASGTSIGLAIPHTAIHAFLRENCYAEIFDADAESFADCEAAKKAEAEKAEKE